MNRPIDTLRAGLERWLEAEARVGMAALRPLPWILGEEAWAMLSELSEGWQASAASGGGPSEREAFAAQIARGRALLRRLSRLEALWRDLASPPSLAGREIRWDEALRGLLGERVELEGSLEGSLELAILGALEARLPLLAELSVPEPPLRLPPSRPASASPIFLLADLGAEIRAAAPPSASSQTPDPEAAQAEDAEPAPRPEALASALLEATEALLPEVRRWLEPADSSLRALLQALRFGGLDGIHAPEGRWRRLAGHLGALGFERELGERVRIERSHAGVDPRPWLLPISPPWQLSIVPSAFELGLSSELLGAQALGRALALCLASPGLPPALRRPGRGLFARALGDLLAQTPLEPRPLAALDAAMRERVRRGFGALWILETRVLAAAALADASGLEGFPFLERLAEALGAALGVEIPLPLAAPLALSRGEAPDRLRSRHASLLAWAALRDRYDEDWYRNPRSAEVIRAACGRGEAMLPERFVEELGADPGSAPARLLELFPT
ncbi:MAG: hypothetical protein OEY14_05060 [Myxococcales bacterium]|nr:hypothetical protein [Myxococcales bacterium]